MPSGDNPKSWENLKKGNRFTEEVASEYGKKGAERSAEVRRERKSFRELMNTALDSEVTVKKKHGEEVKMTAKEAIITRAVKDAIEGDSKAREFCRDTAGEKPVDKLQISEINPEDINEVEQMINEIKEEKEKEK